jgi:hypothetical protein
MRMNGVTIIIRKIQDRRFTPAASFRSYFLSVCATMTSTLQLAGMDDSFDSIRPFLQYYTSPFFFPPLVQKVPLPLV